MSEPIKLVIFMEGGLVTEIMSAGVPVDVVVVDYDTEGADEHRIAVVPTSSPSEAYVTPRGLAEIDGPLVLDIFELCASLPDEPLLDDRTLVCSLCGQPQFETHSGTTCENGHGGAEGYYS